MSYIPLLTLLLTIGGGALAGYLVEPPPRPRAAAVIDHMPLTRRAGFTPFGVPPVTTPPGDPSLFADVRCCRYTPPPVERPRLTLRSARHRPPAVDPSPATVARAAWRADVAPFVPPVPVLLDLQAPGDHERVA